VWEAIEPLRVRAKAAFVVVLIRAARRSTESRPDDEAQRVIAWGRSIHEVAHPPGGRIHDADAYCQFDLASSRERCHHDSAMLDA